MKRLIILTLLGILLNSCATQNLLEQSKTTLKEQIQVFDSAFAYDSTYQYVIRRDDKVSISVWGQDDLSVGSTYGIYNSNEVYGKWLMVDANGSIEIPKIGSFNAKGLTIIELKDTLRSRFSEWIVNPVVDVKILNRQLSILGEVRDPGVYDIDKEYNSLFELFSRCGGFENYANLKYVKIFRQEGPHVRVATINLKDYGVYLSQNIQLLPSDIVVVPSRKYKEFDKRISVIIPFTSAVTSAAIFMNAF
ncbi:MAG: polysaccharide export protein [Bacteroidia bacterium]|nr:polysaccharide export protein [Bacteroidia bacterium]